MESCWDQDMYPPPMYSPMTGYYPPYPPANGNPVQELQMMGYKDPHFSEIPGTSTEQYGVELNFDGIENTFTGFGISKKKARKLAATAALEFLYESGNIPEDTKVPKNRPMYIPPQYPHPWGEMAPFPGHYPMYYKSPQKTPNELDTPPIPSRTPTKQLTQPKETPFTILLEKYPSARFTTEATTTVKIDDQEFSVTVPGSNPHLSRMHTCVAALKTLEGMDFPVWDEKLERVIKNSENPHSMSLHPVTLLMKEFGSRNISFKHNLITEPCTLMINISGQKQVYSSAVCQNKRQAKYEVAIAAINELDLDKKYTNILPYGEDERKRKHQEPESKDVTELSQQLSIGLEVEASPPKEEVDDTVTTKPDSPVAEPPSEQVASPIRDKKIRIEVPESMETETQSPSDVKRFSPRYLRRGTRSTRITFRGQRGQVFPGRRFY